MAFNSYYPPIYQVPIQQPQNQQIQNNGSFIPVPSEEFARNYPVAPGNSVTFKNENAPYVYTKTMGFSQLDRPIFEKYKLIREEDTSDASESRQNQSKIEKVDNSSLDELKAEIDKIWAKIKSIEEILDEGA